VIVLYDRIQECQQLLGFLRVFLVGDVAAEGTHEVDVVHPSAWANRDFRSNDSLSKYMNKTPASG
jgi:hypothetical protein